MFNAVAYIRKVVAGPSLETSEVFVLIFRSLQFVHAATEISSQIYNWFPTRKIFRNVLVQVKYFDIFFYRNYSSLKPDDIRENNRLVSCGR